MTRAKLTQAEKDWRRAQRKAQAMNAKAQADAGPLFADQADQTTAQAEYWRWRRQKALHVGGIGIEDLLIATRRWNHYVVRRLARLHMPAEDYAIARAGDERHGPTLDYWRAILTGRKRLVLDYERISHGHKPLFLTRKARPTCPGCEHGCSGCEEPLAYYLERLELRERLVWPPAGWQPPLTEAQLDALLVTAGPADFDQAVDPLGLALPTPGSEEVA